MIEALQQDGLEIVDDDTSGATVRDRNLLSGDSPLATDRMGKDCVTALPEEFGEWHRRRVAFEAPHGSPSAPDSPGTTTPPRADALGGV
ncbi:hypothetical protein [Brevibacterium renqingii]|uniref:hypothetical protein n=1 Tax=Brevibacterium renqingii TaxID=2776916 RepID=UPI001AE0CA37|nr:hypothetical protein [Brevibacterium renqingii]